MAGNITKVVRLKIVRPLHPTTSWKVFNGIMKTLHEEVRIASNRVVTRCNLHYSNMQYEIDDCEGDKLSKELYRIVQANAPRLYSYNANSISHEMEKLYFGKTNKNSYTKKMERGDGNPPMSFGKTAPIPLAAKKSFKFEVTDGGFYDFEFALVSKKFTSEWNEKQAKENPDECFPMKNGVFKVGIDTTSKAVRSVVERCMSGEYQMGGSELVEKDGKYYIHLTYSFVADTSKELYADRVLGVDVGANVPACTAVNFNTYSRKFIGGRALIEKKLEMERKLKDAQRTATVTTINGHGRKEKVKVPTAIRHKRSNYTETVNRRIAKIVVDEALHHHCATIKMEKLIGFYAKFQKDKFLDKWTYYQLQQFIEQKAKQYGIAIQYVNPKHTSQQCSECGYVDPGNRPKDERGAEYFRCLKCGHEEHADFNAAKNIARKESIEEEQKKNKENEAA